MKRNNRKEKPIFYDKKKRTIKSFEREQQKKLHNTGSCGEIRIQRGTMKNSIFRWRAAVAVKKIANLFVNNLQANKYS